MGQAGQRGGRIPFAHRHRHQRQGRNLCHRVQEQPRAKVFDRGQIPRPVSCREHAGWHRHRQARRHLRRADDEPQDLRLQRSRKTLAPHGKLGAGDGEFNQPGGIAISKAGVVYVADHVNRRVQCFTRNGKFLGKWGEYGSKPGQFDGVENPKSRTGGPHFLAFDRDGNVFTTEAKLGRVQKFTPEGKPLLAFGDNGTQPGGFGGRPKNLPGPIGIAIDRWNRIWVSSTNNRVQCFASDGKFLFGLESLDPGDKPGQFHTPHALAFDSKDRLYVVDAQNQRIQKFAIPKGEKE